MKLIQFSVVIAIFGCSFSLAYIFREKVQPQEPSALSESLDETRLDLNAEFEQFKLKYDRKYPSPSEERQRFQNFVRSHRVIEKLRASEMGTAVYGINNMSDLSEAEFRTYFANLDSKKLQSEFARMEQLPIQGVEVPDEIDWRKKGKVTQVKNQRSCGSEWAFATVAQLESRNLIVNPNSPIKELSEQQLIDCDEKSSGCNGGSPHDALDYVMRRGGLQSGTTYPYAGRKNTCRAVPAKFGVQVTGIQRLQNEMAMKNYTADRGPTINAINAKKLQYYKGGVMDGGGCQGSVNHFVTVVGYNSKQSFWICKNSWGTGWGEEGYFRIKMNRNACGLANFVIVGDVKKRTSQSRKFT